MATGQSLSFDQIQQLWINNGGPPGWAPLMAAIAQAESGGNTAALNNNPSTGDYSVGLWQINYFDGMLASRTNAYGSPAALQADPNLQAKAAISLFANGAGNSNWQGDAAWHQWQAHGAPSMPSAATVQSWGYGGGGGGSTTGASATGGTAAGGPSGVGSNDLSQCMLQLPGFLFFSGPCLMTRGNWKAITSAVAIGVGMGLTGFGIVLIFAGAFESSGAKQAVTKATRTVGIPASLLAGQPEIAAGLKSMGGGKNAGRNRSALERARPDRALDVRVAGRRESRQIEDQYRQTVEQQGPIGPRGGSSQSRRVAYEQRRGSSVPGSGRPRTPEQRARARQRATEPF